MDLSTRVGAGFKIKNVILDYAFTNLANQSNPLYTHIFSLRINLVKKENEIKINDVVMKKILFTVTLLLLAFAGFSQLSNSWIDYNKTYYKFKLTKDTLCRIYQPTLATIGLGSTNAQNFQLWRNGKK